MSYRFEKYDVLQCQHNDGERWLDYSTIRTEEEARVAARFVASPKNAQAPGMSAIFAFRIVRGGKVILD